MKTPSAPLLLALFGVCVSSLAAVTPRAQAEEGIDEEYVLHYVAVDVDLTVCWTRGPREGCAVVAGTFPVEGGAPRAMGVPLSAVVQALPQTLRLRSDVLVPEALTLTLNPDGDRPEAFVGRFDADTGEFAAQPVVAGAVEGSRGDGWIRQDVALVVEDGRGALSLSGVFWGDFDMVSTALSAGTKPMGEATR